MAGMRSKGTKLTFEHVPPQAAGNDEAVKVYGIEEWLSRDLESGEMPGGYVQPKGTGAISICKSCNEYSGAWYVPEFAKFVHTGVSIFRQLTQASIEEADRSLDWKVVDFAIKGMRALPVTKQIVASLLGFGHTALPGDYRSKAKVDAEVAANNALLKAEPG